LYGFEVLLHELFECE